MERVYEEAFSEVDEIIKLMPIDISSKIPQKFRQVISENKALNYKTNIQEPIKEQDLKPETVTILGLIYRDYLASPEIKEKLQKEDEEQLTENENSLVQYKEPGIFKKIINFFKGIFKKNKILKKCRYLLTYGIVFAKITAFFCIKRRKKDGKIICYRWNRWKR